jgi:hypothetical protein
MTNDHWAERKRGRGPERMVTGPARDALIDHFAEQYPEPGTPSYTLERDISDEVRDAADLAREPGSSRPLPARVTDAFFGRKRSGRTR